MTLLPPYLAQTGYYQQGLPVLREAIARRYSERGLPTRPDEVMVVNGALSAFALILVLGVDPETVTAGPLNRRVGADE
ncbi:hypothetical protein JTL69_35005, partial [Pseudomonas aeruginosa]|nr:hypothetical protein [Pseudomonas aeruginosa]